MPKKTKKVTKKKESKTLLPECTSENGHRTVALGQNEYGKFNVRCNECHHEWTAETFDG